MALAKARDRMVDDAPQERCFVDELGHLAAGVANLVRERREHVAHHERLFEEVCKRVPPPEPRDAAHERGRMPDDDDHVHVEAFGQPFRRKERDWILDQRTVPSPPTRRPRAALCEHPRESRT